MNAMTADIPNRKAARPVSTVTKRRAQGAVVDIGVKRQDGNKTEPRQRQERQRQRLNVVQLYAAFHRSSMARQSQSGTAEEPTAATASGMQARGVRQSLACTQVSP